MKNRLPKIEPYTQSQFEDIQQELKKTLGREAFAQWEDSVRCAILHLACTDLAGNLQRDLVERILTRMDKDNYKMRYA